MRARVFAGFLATVIILFGAVMVSGCGDNNSTATTNTLQDSQQAYQKDVQALKASAANFQNPNTYTSAANLKIAFQDLQDTFNKAVDSGKQVQGARISMAQDAFDKLKSTVNDIASSDQTLSQKVDQLKSAFKAFQDQLQQI